MHRLVATARLHAIRRVLALWGRPSGEGLMRLGGEGGGWWVPQAVAAPGKVAYCAGAGKDITFDIALVERGCRVTTFDPTPCAIAHVEQHAPKSDRFRFVPVGWWDQTDTLRFYAPANPAHVSHSAVNLQRTSDYFEAPVSAVHKLAAEAGDERVDLIKMDIEGAEYRVIDSLLADGPRPEVLCVEFDQPQPIRRTVRAIMSLRRAGYAVAKTEGLNFTFVARDGQPGSG